MLKAISYWSVKGGLEATRPVEEAMDEAKAAGFQAIELAIGEKGVFTPATDQATCEKYRKAADAKGLRVETVCSGMSWGCCPTDLDPAVRQKALELNTAALQRTAWVGAKSYLYVPGAVRIPWEPNYKPVPYDRAVSWARESARKLADTAAKVGVELCVENVWNGMFYSPLEFRDFVDSLQSPAAGVYFDVGNMLGLHQWPPHWIALLGKRIKRIHLKDFKLSVGTLAGFCDLLAGDLPWKETMAALRDTGYDRTLVAEMMPPDDTLLARTSKAMDQILAM